MPFNQNKKGKDMKKELIMLGSMVAMSAALSSCGCKRGGDAAYRQNQQNVYATAPRVVNYKDGGTVRGTTGYIQPTSAEGTTLTAPVQQPRYQQPVQRVNPCSQVQPAPVRYVPAPQQSGVQKVIVREVVQDPVGIVLPAHINYVNSSSGAYYDVRCHGYRSRGRYKRGGHHKRGGRPPRRQCTYGTIGNRGGFLGNQR